jgi:hypothetical protein
MLAPKRMRSVIQAHRKVSQEYVRQYRLAYRDGLDISQQSGFEENAGVVNNLEAAAKGTREDLGERGTVVNEGSLHWSFRSIKSGEIMPRMSRSGRMRVRCGIIILWSSRSTRESIPINRRLW